MTFKRCFLLLLSVLLVGCGMVDPDRPTPQPDTNVFGNLLEVTPDPAQQGAQVVKIRIGLPRELVQAQQERGKPTPGTEEFTTAEVTVGPDTVVLRHGEPATLDAFNPGSEVVALPLAGTTRMIGTTRVLLEGSYLLDFETYRDWQLPTLSPAKSLGQIGDPARINTPGVEYSPVPVADGHVLYFTARWRKPWRKDGAWSGAPRQGLPAPEGEGPAHSRTFRTELGKNGWSRPALVDLPGVDDAQEVRVTWVNGDETRCLVTVRGDGEPWVGSAERASSHKPWGDVTRLSQLGEGGASGAVYLAGSTTMIAFSSDRAGGMGQQDIYLYRTDQNGAMPLDPRINTPAREWAPRVGPGNELLFCRLDRQLMYAGGVVNPLRLPGPYRMVLSEANPTADGAHVFFCMPRYTPVEMDQDIFVASWDGKGALGAPVAVDDWRGE